MSDVYQVTCMDCDFNETRSWEHDAFHTAMTHWHYASHEDGFEHNPTYEELE